jgi:AcrR family transcriptional regulator
MSVKKLTKLPITKRKARKQSYEEKIIRSAQDIFAENSYHSTSVDEIAKRAGISKRTLYDYFPSKIALYSRMYDDYHNDMYLSLLKIAKLKLPSDELLLKYLDIFFNFTKEHEKFMRCHMWVLDTDELSIDISDDLKRRVFDRINAMREVATDFFVQALEDDGRLIDIDPHLLVDAVQVIIKGIYIHANKDRRFKQPRIAPEDFLELFKIMIKRGLTR